MLTVLKCRLWEVKRRKSCLECCFYCQAKIESYILSRNKVLKIIQNYACQLIKMRKIN